jgi:hypothetical protein
MAQIQSSFPSTTEIRRRSSLIFFGETRRLPEGFAADLPLAREASFIEPPLVTTP